MIRASPVGLFWGIPGEDSNPCRLDCSELELKQHDSLGTPIRLLATGPLTRPDQSMLSTAGAFPHITNTHLVSQNIPLSPHTRHSLIVTREGLILTLSILVALRGWIWCPSLPGGK